MTLKLLLGSIDTTRVTRLTAQLGMSCRSERSITWLCFEFNDESSARAKKIHGVNSYRDPEFSKVRK